MPNLELTFACDDYLHTRAIREGTVRPEGIDLTYLTTFPAETFQRMLQYGEFDVSEMGLKFYLSSLGMPDPPFVAIPVFPARSFRHSAIYVNAKAGIAKPEDLAGKRIGEPFAYGHDAAIWARGILSDEYGVPLNSPTYFVGAFDRTHSRDFAPFLPTIDVRVEPLKAGQTLVEMLANGDLDALYSALVPRPLIEGDPRIVRLFADYEAAERAYFRKTGIFPIMHTVVIRREIYRRNPWVAQSLYRAFNDAKAEAMASYRRGEAGMNRTMMLPWATALLEENRRLFGADSWPYGIEANRKTLETFARYHHEQGLSKRKLAVEELFAPETLTEYATFG